jgi:hypothetical protein
MLEMRCNACGETFIGDADCCPLDREHIQREDGSECNGQGEPVRTVDLVI